MWKMQGNQPNGIERLKRLALQEDVVFPVLPKKKGALDI
jgi:hypothetical protein